MSGAKLKVPELMDRQPALGRAGSFEFPRARSQRLKNGLRLVLAQKRDLPLVSLRLVLPVGAVHDTPQTRGTAYTTSRMLLQGAGKRGALQLSSALLDLGATLDTWVDEDFTTLSLRVLRRNLEPALDLFADVLLRPRFSPAELKRVRERMRDQALQRRQRPTLVAYLAFKAAVFGEHPYGRPLLPRPADIERLRAPGLRAFHTRHYRPGGAVLVAAGDLSPAGLRGLLERRLGDWQGAAPEAPKRRFPARGPRLVLVHRGGSTQSVLQVGHLAPARRTPEHIGLQLLNTALGGSFTSRLNQNLRERHGFTYGVHSYFSLQRRRGVLSIRTEVETRNTVAALAEIFRELRAIRDRPLAAQELQKAGRLVTEELPGQAETVRGLVDVYADLAAHGLSLQTPARIPEQVRAQSREGLLELARRRLHPDLATIVVVGEMEQLGPALVAAHGRAQLRDLDGELVSSD
jgi:zinc protease